MTEFRILPGPYVHGVVRGGKQRHIHTDQALADWLVEVCFRAFDELGIDEHQVFAVECGDAECDPVVVTYWPDDHPTHSDGSPIAKRALYPRRL